MGEPTLFYSTHTKEGKQRIEVVLLSETDFEGVSDFKEHPVMLDFEGLLVYLRKQEANKLTILLNAAMQDLDRKEIEEGLK
jgi:hypothetical protein